MQLGAAARLGRSFAASGLRHAQTVTMIAESVQMLLTALHLRVTRHA